ncbi:MAG TPA: 2OG-Fe(II) oxygenase [Usitatibacter sp.]|nr:2OG-Fe(II) oxygenase [Usitatibacter sp.]
MASTKPRELDRDWTQWLHTNVSRGCSVEELKGILRKEGFAEHSISWALASAPRPGAPVTSAPLEAGIPQATVKLPNAIAHGEGKAQLLIADDFLTAPESEEIVALILARLRPSTISAPSGAGYDQTFRTSRTCDLHDADPAVARLDTKIFDAIGFDKSLAEPTQGQHYEIGQVFKTHTDFFKPYELERYTMATLGQRTWTFMIYLNDPEGGGETEFPDLGLKVSPKRGRAVLWNNLHSTGQGNDATRHQSLPVTAGTKTIITKWFRMPRRQPRT